jgi:hypothetical protein
MALWDVMFARPVWAVTLCSVRVGVRGADWLRNFCQTDYTQN